MERALTEEQKLKVAKLRVLIVDDSAVDRLFLKTSLQKIGVLSIQEAVHGADGISKILSSRDMGTSFHIILTDWKMPRQDGIAFLKEVRAEKLKVRPHMIMLTSLAEETSVVEAMAAGIDDYILKPFSLSVVSDKLAAALEKISV